VKLRQARKARTREALLDAAARVMARRGYHRASVEEIAEEAGFSTGAVYSSFAGKDDLFLTLVEREVARETAAFVETVAAGETVEQRVQRGAAYWMGFVRRDPNLFLLIMEFWGRAVRDPEVGRRYAAAREALTTAVATLIDDARREFGLDLPIPVRYLAVAAEALADGLALRQLADPEAVPEDLMSRTLLFLAPWTRASAQAVPPPD
jgi:AcrR family transcriptional regulator